jgi:ribosomal protein L11 methylase PrmA
MRSDSDFDRESECSPEQNRQCRFPLGRCAQVEADNPVDIIAANLYSKLLIEVLPKLRRSKWLILSGVLHTGEKEFLRALRRKNIAIIKVNRRGKWIAVLANFRCALPVTP